MLFHVLIILPLNFVDKNILWNNYIIAPLVVIVEDNCLTNNYLKGIQLNDEISSFEITGVSTNVSARFYENCNFSGKSLYVIAYAGYTLSYANLSSVRMGSFWWWKNWNNEISSFSILVP